MWALDDSLFGFQHVMANGSGSGNGIFLGT